MTGFTAGMVTADQLRIVFPLVREAVPGLDLKTWLGFSRRMVRRRWLPDRGIVAVRRSARAQPCGLFGYHCQKDLAHDAILVANHFMALDVLDPPAVMRALTQELELLASRLGCGAIRATVVREGSLADAGLRAAGLNRQGTTLWKRLTSGPPATGRERTR
jgi:hypothetical protein